MYLYIIRIISIVVLLTTGLLGCTTMGTRYREVRMTDTVPAYEDFLKEYPESPYDGEIKERIKVLSWDKTKSTNTTDAYDSYIRKYPGSEFTNEAKEEIERISWLGAKKTGSVESFKNYLKKYPDGKYKENANKKVLELHWKEIREIDEIEYYEKFLKEHSETDFASLARERIEAIPWEKAKKTNTREAYDRFIIDYPHNKFIVEAKNKIKTLQLLVIFDKKLKSAKNFHDVEKLYWDNGRFIKAELPNLEKDIIKRIASKQFATKYVTVPNFSPTQLINEEQLKTPRRLLIVKDSHNMITDYKTIGTGFSRSGGTLTNGIKFTKDYTCGQNIKGMLLFKNTLEVSAEFDGDEIIIHGEPQIAVMPFGHESIHRFIGQVNLEIGDIVAFIGEGDTLNRLTFSYINGIGYVYIRGVGKIMLRDGSTIEL